MLIGPEGFIPVAVRSLCHLVWRDSVGVESSGSELQSECADIFHQSFLWLLRAPKRAKQLSMATIPFCFEFFRCRVDVLQS